MKDKHMSLRIDRDTRHFAEIHVVGHLQHVHVPVEGNIRRSFRRHGRRRDAELKQSDETIFHKNPPQSGRLRVAETDRSWK